ncbi:MAG: molybdate ABC transporter substrate-binding protein [Desulfocapsaceae bacterium]|nr:molybdate ABC transporter substrate-binding protein [Desulfocapsaceae bacterium]
MGVIRILSLLVILSCSCISTLQAAEKLTIAAGAGYRRLVEQLSTAYTASTGVTVEQIFGNMAQVTAQAQESSAIDFIIGDKEYLDTTPLSFAQECVVGSGKLIAAVAKGSALKTLNDLTEKTVTRIAIPDPKKATFGRAATEFLSNKGLWQQIQDRVLIVGTVPQVTAYVISGEVDVGFINLTEALAIKDKAGLLIPVDEHLYTPVLIVAKRLRQSPDSQAANAFITFLQTGEAQDIIKKQGL